MGGFGIYIHIPFCRGRCPYCDFYSLTDRALTAAYTDALIDELRYNRRASAFVSPDVHEREVTSLYFGGGTPSLLPDKKLAELVKTVRDEYNLSPTAEITVECNPSTPDLPSFFNSLADVGVNRISLGLQSAVDNERRALGRQGTGETVSAAINSARQAGISNISLDVMLGIPLQTRESLRSTLDFCLAHGVRHISAYMLKLEPGTRFYKQRDTLCLPCEDEVCDNYLYTCAYLAGRGLPQYEISNFAQRGFESRHNLLYWNGEEYLGTGAAAHSYINGKRFFFERSAQGFIDGNATVFDSLGGSVEEYTMLRLRLNEGLTENAFYSRFGQAIPTEIRNAAKKVPSKYIVCDEHGIRLTAEGFLISNSIISLLLTGEIN